MKLFIKKTAQGGKGMLVFQVLIYASIAIILLTGLVNWGGVNINATRKLSYSEQAFQIAEAGIEYYRWHLAHASTDYKDGTTTPGPYVHTFNDKDGVPIGTFSLDIVAPPIGSTIVTITSTGKTNAAPTVQRKIQAKLAIPSLAKYAIVANDNMRFGAGTEIFGPIHSNGGIRFDGLAHNLVTSARSTYTDPDDGSNEFGVYTTVNPADPHPPAAVPSRLDVFQTGRQFPVPAVDFTGFASDLSSMKTLAQSNGKYLAPSGAQGYHIVFNTNDTYRVYKVTNLAAAPNNCTNSANQTGWGTWSIKATNGQTEIAGSPFANPANGIIFAEDNVWVDGQINTARVTVVAAKFPDTGTRPDVTVNTDLLYTNYDGQDVLALIAQGDFNVGLVSDTDLRVDAAIIAQNGRTGRYYYGSNCSPYHQRTLLTLYGMIASNIRYGFAYTDGTGYDTRTIIYDANLLYAPPPSFPLTSNQYTTISWQEIK